MTQRGSGSAVLRFRRDVFTVMSNISFMGSSKAGNACVFMCNFFSFSLQLPEAAFLPSHWVEEKMIHVVYQISWLIFLFITSADKPSATSRHRQPGTSRPLIYWELRRAVPLFPCTIRHRFPPHGHWSFDTSFTVANGVILQYHARMWVCFGSPFPWRTGNKK